MKKGRMHYRIETIEGTIKFIRPLCLRLLIRIDFANYLANTTKSWKKVDCKKCRKRGRRKEK